MVSNEDALVKPKPKNAARKRRRVVPEVVALAVPASRSVAKTGLPAGRARELLDAFFRKRSAITVKNYRSDLTHFGRWWCAQRKKTFSDKNIDESIAAVLQDFFALDHMGAFSVVTEYVNLLRSGKLGIEYSPHTINHRMTALRSVTDLANMFGFCSFRLHEIENLPVSKSLRTRGCGEEGFARLLAYAEDQVDKAETAHAKFLAARNVVLILLMHNAALRRFEGLQLRWPDDVNLDDGEIRFRGKRRTEREWFDVLEGDTITAIHRYLAHRGMEAGYLLHGRKPTQPLDVSSVNRVVKILAEGAGVRVTPHGLRHTAATTVLNKSKGNVRGTSALLRHVNDSLVARYDDERQKLPKQMSKLLTKAK